MDEQARAQIYEVVSFVAAVMVMGLIVSMVTRFTKRALGGSLPQLASSPEWLEFVNYIRANSEAGEDVDELFRLEEEYTRTGKSTVLKYPPISPSSLHSGKKMILQYYLLAVGKASDSDIEELYLFLKDRVPAAASATRAGDKETRRTLKEAFEASEKWPTRAYKVLSIDTFMSYIHQYEEYAFLGYPLSEVLGWPPRSESPAVEAVLVALRVLAGASPVLQLEEHRLVTLYHITSVKPDIIRKEGLRPPRSDYTFSFLSNILNIPLDSVDAEWLKSAREGPLFYDYLYYDGKRTRIEANLFFWAFRPRTPAAGMVSPNLEKLALDMVRYSPSTMNAEEVRRRIFSDTPSMVTVRIPGSWIWGVEPGFVDWLFGVQASGEKADVEIEVGRPIPPEYIVGIENCIRCLIHWLSGEPHE